MLFEKASKLKLRFASGKGLLSVEDLWDLPLTAVSNTSLDSIAKGVNAQLKESETESFVISTPKADRILQLKLDILKHIIKIRLEELDVAKAAAFAKYKKQQIMAIIADKESETLKETSLDDLRKMLDEL